MKYGILAFLLLSLPFVAFAQTGDTGFVSLTGIAGLRDSTDAPNLAAFLNQVYKICIGLAAALAVLQIMRAGIMYMGGDSVTEKKEAKNLIAVSIGGLILVLSPVIVFSIINPDILDLKITGIEKLDVPLTPTESVPLTPTTGDEQMACKLTYAETKSSTQACSTLGAGWENVTASCCVAFSGTSYCCGRLPQLPDNSHIGSGKASYKIAVLSSDFTKLGSPSCVEYVTGSHTDSTACSSDALAAETRIKSSNQEYTVVKNCGDSMEKSLQGTKYYNLPTCSQ